MSIDHQPQPEPDRTVNEAADVIRMSERWLRQQIKDGRVECERRGHKIFFTPSQMEKLRHSFTVHPSTTSITTGRKKKAS